MEDAEIKGAAKQQMESGAVTFLDVLGWKGIWLRRSAKEVLKQLEGLIALAEKTANEFRGIEEFTANIRVLSISDTIVLLTSGDAEKVLPVHGLICQELLTESIRLGMPLRGATSYGNYSVSSGTILVGPAVDEAASWHEALDWIGVVMTPTAEYTWSPIDPWIQYKHAPVKSMGNRTFWCVNWCLKGLTESELKEFFAKAAPLDTNVAGKYINTFEFMQFVSQVNVHRC